MTPQAAHRIAVFAAVLFVSGAAHMAPAAAEDRRPAKSSTRFNPR